MMRPLDQHRDAVGEAEHRVDVVLDQQHRGARAQPPRSALPCAPTRRGPCRPSARRAAPGAAGSPAPCRPRGRAARRATARRSRASARSARPISSSTCARARRPQRRCRAAPAARRPGSRPAPPAPRGRRCSSTSKLLNRRVIWNERASPRRARWCGARRVMSSPSKTMRPRSGAQLAGELRHQRRLAGAVRADQRVHLAAAHLQVDAVGRDHAAEALAQAAARRAAARSRGIAHRGLKPLRSEPASPWRANSTTASSTQPVQNSQCGV